MNDARTSLIEQFAWEPVVVGAPPQAPRALVGGMGGSHLAADLLAAAAPELDISVHHDYGLPRAVPQDAMAVAVSHSGNTEETLDFLRAARAQGMPCAAISLGGSLIEFAAANNIPHIVLPQSPLPPRVSVGYHAVALLTLMGRAHELEALRAAAQAPAIPHEKLVAHIGGGIPLIYASQKNAALAQYLKIQLNETPRAPAFANTFPELNHNEMVATLGDASSRVVLIRDQSDDPRVIRRMDAFEALARERGIAVESVGAPQEPFARLASVAALAQSLAMALAQEKRVEPFDASIVEDFKKRII
jgi:glucose/mannose-6-phosphate isomerase